jgi:toxin ParE1/3/4
MSYYNFSDLAIDDIEQICDFLAQTNPKFASQLFDTIRQKCKLVANFPNRGKDYSWIDSNLRGLIVDDYIIFYYPREEGISIARVIYGRRDLIVSFKDFRD